MKSLSVEACVCLFLSTLILAPGLAQADQPATAMRTLSNGVRVVCVHFPGSTNVAIFTYLPMGLASDGPEQAQWSHLVEHLIIRSTLPDDLTRANAETIADHMRLDFYGNIGDWQEGLSHHKRWLQGVPFTETSLAREKPRVNSECDYTAKNFSAHKFALAAWAQGIRYDQTNAALKGDINRATLKEIQKYRDNRLIMPRNIVMCIVGGVEPAKVFAAVKGLESLPAADQQVPVRLHPGDREMTWDLDARHLLLTWPIPDCSQAADFAPLLTAAQWLNAQFFSDPELKKLTGMTLAGVDLKTPEGNFFYVSASLRPEADFKQVRAQIGEKLRSLVSPNPGFPMLSMLGGQLGKNLTEVPDPKQWSGQTSPAMAEMNIGLQWGMNEFRYGTNKLSLAKTLQDIDIKFVQRAAKIWLADSKRSILTLQPAKP
jgi:hypothetical protein